MFRVRQILLVLLVAAASLSLFANSVLLSGDADVTDLRWKNGVIRVAVSASLLRESSNIKSGSDVTGAVRRSLEAWSRIANVEFVQVSSDKLNVSPSGPAGDGVSLITVAQSAENVLLFAPDPANAAATTRIFYGRRGEISEADIVLNPYQQFSTDGTFGTFDLESTLTHEIGHLLGLGHSTVLGATMSANYGRNGLFGLQNFTSRTLSIADIAAARAIYGNANSEASDCCGSVSGHVAVTGRTLKGALVWLEDIGGRVHGSSAIS